MVVLEVINRYESDSYNTMNSTAEFISRFDTSLLKMHIDTFHMNMEESDMVQPIIQAKELIGHVHFADNNRMYPGAGCFDFKRVIHALNEINYTGHIAMECLPLPTSDEAARGAILHLRSLLA